MTTRAKAEARKAVAIARTKAVKGKTVSCNVNAMTELPHMIDAIFDGDEEMPGWVIMAANPKGRELVNALFPNVHIEWSRRRGFSPDWPAEWLGFKINVPDVCAATQHKLPTDIMPKGYRIDDCSPTQLSFLLALGVKDAGGRAAQLMNDPKPHLEIYVPNNGVN